MTFGHSHYPKGGALQVHEGLPRVSKFAVSDVGMINRPVLRAEGALVESRTRKKKELGQAPFLNIFSVRVLIIAYADGFCACLRQSDCFITRAIKRREL